MFHQLAKIRGQENGRINHREHDLSTPLYIGIFGFDYSFIKKILKANYGKENHFASRSFYIIFDGGPQIIVDTPIAGVGGQSHRVH